MVDEDQEQFVTEPANELEQASPYELSLTVQVPRVSRRVRVLVVRCGQTVAEVREHGQAGSGDWAAWTGSLYGGNRIGEGGTARYEYERAVHDAMAWVQSQELRRLLHLQVQKELGQGDE